MPHPMNRKPLEARSFALEIRNRLTDNGCVIPFEYVADLEAMIRERDAECVDAVSFALGGTAN